MKKRRGKPTPDPLVVLHSNQKQPTIGSSVQLDIPIEIIAPAFRRVLEDEREIETGHPFWLGSLPNKSHAALLGCLPSLSTVAINTSRDNVLPALGSAAGHGNDMVEGKFFTAKLSVAVLAGVTVSRVNIGAGEFYNLALSDPHIFEQT